MQGVSSLFEMFQRYFEADIILPILIAAVPWLVGTLSKKQKVFLSGVLFFLVILFNGITFWIMEKIGESETYYRFFWILPLGCLVAGLVLKVWDQLKNNWQKLAFVLIAGIAFFLYSDIQPEQWKPRNLYYLPEETMAIADMIREDSDSKVLVNVFDYSKATYGVREYNANIVLVDDGVEMALEDIFNRNLGNITGRLINAVITNNGIEYVYIEKEKEEAQMALVGGGAIYVGETNQHKIYRFDTEELTKLCQYAWSVETIDALWAIEYHTISGVEEPVRFIYTLENGVQVVNEEFEVLDTYFTDEKEFDIAEFEGFTLCNIENVDGIVSADTVKQFEQLTNMEKPIVVLLKEPIADGVLEIPENTDSNMQKLQTLIMAEDTPVSVIYAGGYAYSYRGKLPNGVVQCVCIPDEDVENAIITVKGE